MRIITQMAVTAVIAGTIGAGLTGVYIARVEAMGHTLSIPSADAEPIAVTTEQVAEEDDPEWDCRLSQDRTCGPRGDNFGHDPGCYNDLQELVAPLPCTVVVRPDGGSDVYVP